jgi:predicted molibdopterin-dependent oxidoreductase YjgC
MGITQHTSGTDNVKSLANLAMLCGNMGNPGGGVNPLRGQNNVQGACDMGGLPNVCLPPTSR